jgi:hypothetical protein
MGLYNFYGNYGSNFIVDILLSITCTLHTYRYIFVY